MAYNKTEILALPDEEKLLPITADDIAFAEERLKLHKANPTEGMEWDEVREKIKAKYGF